jgi:hypothetical protein
VWWWVGVSNLQSQENQTGIVWTGSGEVPIDESSAGWAPFHSPCPKRSGLELGVVGLGWNVYRILIEPPSDKSRLSFCWLAAPASSQAIESGKADALLWEGRIAI